MKTRAFTLIELSIVLIIIGLLVGGVLAGRDLIEQAKIGRMVSDIREIDTAFNAFQLKYDAVPGDMDNAHDYFGSACHATPATCNGTGDNLVTTADNEDHMVFNHLANAGVYPGSYLGTGQVIGTDVPPTPIEGGAYWVRNASSDVYTVSRFTTNFINVSGELGSLPDNSLLAAPQGKMFDQKLDDGAASTGKLLGMAGDTYTDCVTAVGGGTLVNPDYQSVPGEVDYNLSLSDIGCRFFYHGLIQY